LVSERLHRGTAGAANTRLVSEITIVPSFRFDMNPVSAGLNAAYPLRPWTGSYAYLTIRPILRIIRYVAKEILRMVRWVVAGINNGITRRYALNIGGGPAFSFPGW